MPDAGLTRAGAISGFPEWLPEVRLVEQHWLDRIRRHLRALRLLLDRDPVGGGARGRCCRRARPRRRSTRCSRLQADPDDRERRTLGLHFDLTVPFARYVAQHFNELVFPFKRYQIQRVWRGERPQEGRFREFTQCDIDVINVDHVPLHFDAELPRIVAEVLTELDVGAFTIGINNRKVLQGFYDGLGIADPIAVIRVADKLDKIGADAVGRAARRRARADGRLRYGVPGPGPDPRTDASVVDAMPGSVRAGRPARGGPDRAGVRAGRARRPAGRDRRRRPVDRPRPGLLHRHRLRGHARSTPPASAASAPAGATTTWPGSSSASTCPASGCRSG